MVSTKHIDNTRSYTRDYSNNNEKGKKKKKKKSKLFPQYVIPSTRYGRYVDTTKIDCIFNIYNRIKIDEHVY